VEPMDAMLVAVHPWDIDGAQRAGLAGAWIDLSDGRHPSEFRGARPPRRVVDGARGRAPLIRATSPAPEGSGLVCRVAAEWSSLTASAGGDACRALSVDARRAPRHRSLTT
jgi:hypothetical protein